MRVYKLILFISLIGILFSKVLTVQAQQKTIVTTTPTVFTSPTPTISISTTTVETKINHVDEQVQQLIQKNNLSSNVELLINILSMFSTIVLGTFVAIGGFLVWNGFTLRQEAKEDLKEIKQFKQLSSEMFLAQQKTIDDYKKTMDETIKNADNSVNLLTKVVNQATKDTKNISELKKETNDTITKYQESKTAYSDMTKKIVKVYDNPFNRALGLTTKEVTCPKCKTIQQFTELPFETSGIFGTFKHYKCGNCGTEFKE